MIHPCILEVIAAALPEVKLDLSVKAENLPDMRHLPHSGHHLEHPLGSPIFLKFRYSSLITIITRWL